MANYPEGKTTWPFRAIAATGDDLASWHWLVESKKINTENDYYVALLCHIRQAQNRLGAMLLLQNHAVTMTLLISPFS